MEIRSRGGRVAAVLIGTAVAAVDRSVEAWVGMAVAVADTGAAAGKVGEPAGKALAGGQAAVAADRWVGAPVDMFVVVVEKAVVAKPRTAVAVPALAWRVLGLP